MLIDSTSRYIPRESASDETLVAIAREAINSRVNSFDVVSDIFRVGVCSLFCAKWNVPDEMFGAEGKIVIDMIDHSQHSFEFGSAERFHRVGVKIGIEADAHFSTDEAKITVVPGRQFSVTTAFAAEIVSELLICVSFR